MWIRSHLCKRSVQNSSCLLHTKSTRKDQSRRRSLVQDKRHTKTCRAWMRKNQAHRASTRWLQWRKNTNQPRKAWSCLRQSCPRTNQAKRKDTLRPWPRYIDHASTDCKKSCQTSSRSCLVNTSCTMTNQWRKHTRRLRIACTALGQTRS